MRLAVDITAIATILAATGWLLYSAGRALRTLIGT